MIILSCDHLTGINFAPRAEFSSPCNVSSIERVALAVSHCSNLSNKTDNRENEWLWSVSVLNGNVFIRWWGDGNLNLCRPDGGRIAAGVVVLLVHKIQSQTMYKAHLQKVTDRHLHSPACNLAMVSPEGGRHPVWLLGKTRWRHIRRELDHFSLTRPLTIMYYTQNFIRIHRLLSRVHTKNNEVYLHHFAL